MGLFSRNTSKKEQTPEPVWNQLTSIEQLNELVVAAQTKPVVIFKHSTRCGISRMVIKQFEGLYDLEENQMKVYYLDLLNYRPISEEIAARFQVWHESPQLVVLKNGVTVAHASHGQINAIPLEQFV